MADISMLAIMLTILTFFASLILAFYGAYEIISLEVIDDLNVFNFYKIFAPIFMIVFALMMVCGELRIKFVLEYFNFLRTLLGRGVWSLFLASMVASSISDNNNDTRTYVGNLFLIIGIIFGFILTGIGIFYLLLFGLSFLSKRVRTVRDSLLGA